MIQKMCLILLLGFILSPVSVFGFAQDSKKPDDGSCYPLMATIQDSSQPDNNKKLSKKERKQQEEVAAAQEKKLIFQAQLNSVYQNLKNSSLQLSRQSPVEICALVKNQERWESFWLQQSDFLSSKNLINEAVVIYNSWLNFYKESLLLMISGDDNFTNSCNLNAVSAITNLKLPGLDMLDLQKLQKIAEELKASKMVIDRMEGDKKDLDEERKRMLDRMMRRGNVVK